MCCYEHFFLFVRPNFPMDGPDMCRTDWLYVLSLYYLQVTYACHIQCNYSFWVTYLTAIFFETGAMGTPSKSQNSTMLSQGLLAKGQLISKCLFGVFNSPKKSTLGNIIHSSKIEFFGSFFVRTEDIKKTFRN